MAEGRRGVGPFHAALRRARMEAALAGTARRHRGRSGADRALARPHVQPDAHRRARSRSPTISTSTTSASARASRLTTAPGAEEEATFSPDGRLVAFVRAQQPLRRRRRRRARARADDRRQPRDPERQARLAVPGGDLRPRPVPRLLVEPRLDAPRVPAARRTAGARIHRRRPHSVPARSSKSPTTRRPATRIRSVKLGVVARHRRRTASWVDLGRVLPRSTSSSSTSTGRRRRRASCSRCRTASRRGST